MYGEDIINSKGQNTQEVDQQQQNVTSSQSKADGITQIKSHSCQPGLENRALSELNHSEQSIDGEKHDGFQLEEDGEPSTMINDLEDKPGKLDEVFVKESSSNVAAVNDEIFMIVEDENKDKEACGSAMIINQKGQQASSKDGISDVVHSESDDNLHKPSLSNPEKSDIPEEAIQPEDLGSASVDSFDLINDGDLEDHEIEDSFPNVDEEDNEFNMVIIRSSQSNDSNNGTNQSEWRKYFRLPPIKLRGIVLPMDYAWQNQVKGSMDFLGSHGYGAWKTGAVPSDVALHDSSK